MLRRSIEAVSGFVGANVRRLRVKQGMTQEALAEQLEVTARFIQRIERGEAIVSLPLLVRAAGTLGVEPFQLLKPARASKPMVGRPKRL